MKTNRIPQVGEIALYFPNPDDKVAKANSNDDYIPAIITRVWSDTCVNLKIFPDCGSVQDRTSVVHQKHNPAGNHYKYYNIQYTLEDESSVSNTEVSEDLTNYKQSPDLLPNPIHPTNPNIQFHVPNNIEIPYILGQTYYDRLKGLIKLFNKGILFEGFYKEFTIKNPPLITKKVYKEDLVSKFYNTFRKVTSTEYSLVFNEWLNTKDRHRSSLLKGFMVEITNNQPLRPTTQIVSEWLTDNKELVIDWLESESGYENIIIENVEIEPLSSRQIQILFILKNPLTIVNAITTTDPKL